MVVVNALVSLMLQAWASDVGCLQSFAVRCSEEGAALASCCSHLQCLRPPQGLLLLLGGVRRPHGLLLLPAGLPCPLGHLPPPGGLRPPQGLLVWLVLSFS